MNPRFVERVLFPLHERLRGRRTLEYLRDLEGNQWLDGSALRDLQLAKLQRLVAHAYREVPYYREAFDAIGLKPRDLRALEDLRALPLLTKEIIRDRLEDLTAPSSRKTLLWNWTSGSSGTPVRFYASREKEALGNTAKLRARRWWGLDIGDPELHVWGNARELGNDSWLRRAKDRLLNTVIVSAYDLSEGKMEGLYGTIRKVRPRSVYGYPSAIAAFSSFALDHRFDLHACGVEHVISTAETLLDVQREVIEEAFGAQVLLEYGAHDGCAVIAHDCPCGKMHTTDDLVYLEFLQDGRPVGEGEMGEVVVTSLDSFGMPFIRYRIGDLARPGAPGCALGRGFRSLEALEGRVSELMYTQDGTPVPALFLTNSLKRVSGIVDFQVEQTTLTRFVLRLVTSTSFSPGSEDRIERVFRERFGQDVTLVFEYPEALAVGPSGKKQWALCSIGKGARGVA